MDIKALEYKENAQRISSLLELHLPQQFDSILPAYEVNQISCAVCEGGVFSGGVTGKIVWNHLHIDLLAVDQTARRKGVCL